MSESGNLPGAIEALEGVTTSYPYFPDAYIQLGVFQYV